MRVFVTAACALAAALILGTSPVTHPHLQGRAVPLAGEPPRHAAAAPVQTAGSSPALPREAVDVRMPKASGRTIRVAASESLQQALDEARPGDRIVLEAGATYTGPFTLPRKDGEGWIVVASDGLDSLPDGERVTPDDARHMARLVAGGESAIRAEAGAHHFWIAGVDVAPRAGAFLYNLVELGSGDGNLAQAPHHIVIDRSYLHGDAKRGGRRGVAMNGRHLAVVNSHLSDFKEVGADSQAIAGWNGPGPFRIENNYLEGAGENVMFGGADPAVHGLVPADIEIRRNHFVKPLSWREGHPAFQGTSWAVKNLFELKNARRVLVEQNLFEHNWPHAQNGFAILFTPRNQDGRAPWSIVEDVTFRSNVVRRVAAGFNILGQDDNHKSGRTARIDIRHNLLSELGGSWGGNGRLFQLLDGTAHVAIVNNTAEKTTGGIVFAGDHAPHTGFVFRGNVMPDNGAGFLGSGTGVGQPSIAKYFSKPVITGNVFVNGKPEHYPHGNAVSAGEADARGAGADVRRLMETIGEVVIWRD